MKTLIAPRALKSIDQVPGVGTQYIPIESLRTWTGLAISPETAYNAMTVLQCVTKLQQTFASLPLMVYRRRADGGRDVAREHPLYRALHDRPNPAMSSFFWREILMGHLKTWGNHYSEVVGVGNGDIELWPIRPDRITVDWKNRERQYTYTSPTGRESILPASKVFHVAGMSYDGLTGMSPIGMMRRTLAVMGAAEQYGESVFRNGARPAVVLSHPKTLSDPAVGRLAAQFDDMRGSSNAGKTVVLEEGLTVTEVGFPPEDAQFMETRLFQKRELAGYYGVPGLMIGDPDDKETWDDASRRFMSTVQSDLERFEQEASRQLVDPLDDDIYVEFKADGFLRADPKARADAYAVRWEHGNLNADEWRRLENEDPLPDRLGQDYYRPANWVVLGSDPVAVGGDASTPTQFGQAGPQAVDDTPAEIVAQVTRAKMAQFDCPTCGKMVNRLAAPGTVGYCKGCRGEVTMSAEAAA